MTKHIELKKANQETALATGNKLALPPSGDRRTRGVQGQLRPSVPACRDRGNRGDGCG